MTDKGKDEALKTLRKIWKGGGAVTIEKIDAVGYTVNGVPGHPFCIGPAHVAYASDRHCGMLGEETMRAIPCKAESRELLSMCNQPYESHVTEYGVFVRLHQDVAEKKLSAWLTALKPEMALRGLQGWAFLGTKEFAVLRDGVAMMGRGR